MTIGLTKMCYLLHVKEGYSCNHEILSERQKVCLVFTGIVAELHPACRLTVARKIVL